MSVNDKEATTTKQGSYKHHTLQNGGFFLSTVLNMRKHK